MNLLYVSLSRPFVLSLPWKAPTVIETATSLNQRPSVGGLAVRADDRRAAPRVPRPVHRLGVSSLWGGRDAPMVRLGHALQHGILHQPVDPVRAAGSESIEIFIDKWNENDDI